MRILVAEDDMVIRLLLKRFFGVYGDVVTAANGVEAMELLSSSVFDHEPFDLVCLDIIMPGFDGQEVLEKYRNLEAEMGIGGFERSKIFMITGLDGAGDIMRAFSGQADDYLIKPFDKEQLENKLREHELIS